MKLLLELLLLIILINSIVIDKALGILSPKELKRRAKQGKDTNAQAIYRMAAYGDSLHILLLIKGCLSAAFLFGVLASGSWVMAFIFILVLAYALRVWQPIHATNSWVWSWAAKTAPIISIVMSYLQPIFARVSAVLPHRVDHKPDGIYEKEDLQEFLNHQNQNPENRIPENDLRMAYNALTFGDKIVGDVMTPLRKMKLVTESDQVGPLLMDELHNSGFSRFPVIKDGSSDTSPQIIGTLYLKDLVGYTGSGKVGDLMDKKIFFVNETQSLRSSLDAFLKTHHHLFVVVNNFEEIVGVLSIEDVLEQIVGKEIVDEFDKYDDLREVASKEAQKEHQRHREAHSEPLPEEPANPV